MSASTATVTVPNMTLTPVRVTFNGVDLGGTKNGVSFSPKIDYADIMADQYGKTVLDKRVSGYAMTVKFELAEIQNKDNWKVAFPSIKEVGSGPKAIYSDIEIGDSLYNRAQQLVLHPLDRVDSDKAGDITIYKAASVATPELKFTPDGQVVLAVEMILFPDTGVSPPRWYTFGDTTIGLVAASAGSAVAGGGNTGNGTIGTITVSSGVTKTETITVTCLGQTSGNNFGVSGSVSGALGTFHVAALAGSTASFTSSVINFVFTQGSVQSANGDTYTIATTAANYA